MTPGYIIVKYPSGNSVVNIYLKDSAMVQNVCDFFAEHFGQSVKMPRDLFHDLCSDRYKGTLSPEERPKTMQDYMNFTIPESERYAEYYRNDYDEDFIIVRNSFDNINSLAANIVHKLFSEYNNVLNGDAVRIVPEVDIKLVPYVYTVEVFRDQERLERPYLTAKSSDGIEFAGFVSKIKVVEEDDE